MKRLAILGALALMVTASGAAQAADAAAGEKVYRACRACHVIDKEQNRVGPHLVGIVGRPVAAIEGFRYSNGMVEWGEGKVWDAATLDLYLENPRGVVKGTKMAYPGLKKAEDRANIIAYLEGAGS
ncbi:MAG: cytochrome c family protein [Pseudomonadota bacterium]